MAGFSFFVHMNKAHHFYMGNNPMPGEASAIYEVCKKFFVLNISR